MATEEVRKLSDLLDISQTLGSTLNPRAALTRVLEILEDRHGVVSGSVALLAEGGAELAIEASTGLSGEVARRTRYKVGEGIIGRVVESGKPVVVPQVSQEPLFLDRTGVVRKARAEMSFICVPVVINDRTAGALGVTLPYRRERVYDQEVKYLGIVGSMIGQALRVHRLAEAE